MTFIPLIYRRHVLCAENMPQEPMSFFGWLMNCCVSDDRRSASRETVSAAVVFASGVAASGLTLYLAGLYHLI